MDKTVINIMSPTTAGGTFLDWSIHFLAGQNYYYNISTDLLIPLSKSPIQTANAHGHKKNHPVGYQQAVDYFNQIKNNSQTNIYSCYSYPLLVDQAAEHLNISPKLLQDNAYLKKIFEYIDDDFDKLANFAEQENIKTIYLDLVESNALYANTNVRTTQKLLFEDARSNDPARIYSSEDKIFFTESQGLWQGTDSTAIWDKRERAALNIRPFFLAQAKIKYTTPHLWINSQMLWHFGESTLNKVMSYVGLDIVPERLTLWKDVYYQWQQMQLKFLEFTYNFKHIIDSIVNNWDYELPDLTFIQEATIQHELIYKHNLNLKTWQLNKFPSNAKDLHKLLEPHIHSITKLY